MPLGTYSACLQSKLYLSRILQLKDRIKPSGLVMLHLKERPSAATHMEAVAGAKHNAAWGAGS